jgi:hypothetical protein
MTVDKKNAENIPETTYGSLQTTTKFKEYVM